MPSPASQIHRARWEAFDIACGQIDIGNAATDMVSGARPESLRLTAPCDPS
jgi:hypothetical protein